MHQPPLNNTENSVLFPDESVKNSGAPHHARADPRNEETPVKLFGERLRPSATMFFTIGLVIPASMTVFTPITAQGGVPGIVIGTIVGAVLYAGVIGLLVVMAPVIEVTKDQLRVGHATISRTLIGTVTAYDGSAATRQLGPVLDARAWLCIRGWVKPVIRIAINDPDDPTPYWLVSTRHPEQLVELLQAKSTAA